MIVYWGVGAAFSRSGCAKPSLDHSFSAAVYNVIIKSSFKVLGCVQNVLSVESWHGLWKLLSAIAQGLNVHRIFLVPRHHQVSVPSVYSWPLQKSNRLDCLQFKVPQDGNELGGPIRITVWILCQATLQSPASQQPSKPLGSNALRQAPPVSTTVGLCKHHCASWHHTLQKSSKGKPGCLAKVFL